MKRVLHVGPVESRGGMQATIRHHLQHPPKGWKTESINTHVDGSPLAKILEWRKAKHQLNTVLDFNPPDIVHIHTATKYSWWRKLRAVKMCIKKSVPVVLQIHAGNFHLFLINRPPAAREFLRLTEDKLVMPVALTLRHKRQIGLDKLQVIGSPAPPIKEIEISNRNKNLMILLARPSPIKGHRLAIAATEELRRRGYDVHLHLSGISANHAWVSSHGDESGIHARGWLTGEEKNDLLESAGMLLIPSNYEGMPVAAMEALSCGLPVISSPACKGILGQGGHIIQELDSDVWADELEQILNDDSRWQNMSKNGPAAVANQTPEKLGRQWSKLYNKVIEEVKS